MKKETRYFAQFVSPGSFVAETWTKEIDAPNATQVEWPDNAYAFSILAREDVIDGDTVYRGESKQLGPLYYHPDSKIQTLAEVKENPKATGTLISNMERNGWDRVIWTRRGNWPQPFDPADCVVLRAES